MPRPGPIDFYYGLGSRYSYLAATEPSQYFEEKSKRPRRFAIESTLLPLLQAMLDEGRSTVMRR